MTGEAGAGYVLGVTTPAGIMTNSIAIALVNVHYDAEALNLFVYTHAKVMVSADVVEFSE